MYDTIHFVKKLFPKNDINKWMKKHKYVSFALVYEDEKEKIYAASHELLGGSVWSEIKRYFRGVKMAVSGVRMNYKPYDRKVLEDNYKSKITSLKVVRAPLSSKFKSILGAVNTLSGFNPQTQHDQLFHLALIAYMDNGNIIKVEKNEDVNLEYYVPSSLHQIKDVTLPHPITLQELLEKTKMRIGEKNFFTYDAFSLNCQRFIMDILLSNNVHVSHDLQEFIMQDVKGLVPEWGKKIAYFFTSLANRGKILLQGEGLKK